jgi:hypothetical protein
VERYDLFQRLKIFLRKKGLEPLRPFGHQLLRLARLPIPPLPHWLARMIIQAIVTGERQRVAQG